MLLPIPILIIAIMIGMLVLGLLRPPLTVIMPLLGIYTILMLIPYIIPNITIHQYLNLRYIILPVIGFALGYGISLFANKYMNIDIGSLLGLRRNLTTVKKRRVSKPKPKVAKKPEIKPEHLDNIINETIGTLKLGATTNKVFGIWGEYYDGWADAILGISRNFLSIKDSADLMKKEAMFLSRLRDYEKTALNLGFTVREESSFKKGKSKIAEDSLVVYVNPEDVAQDILTSAQLVGDYVDRFNNIVERLVHDKDQISQYMVDSPVLVIYVDGIPRKFVIIHKET